MTLLERANIVKSWEEWRRILYEERAAIMEFCGQLSREEAEKQAFEKYKPERRVIPEQRQLDL